MLVFFSYMYNTAMVSWGPPRCTNMRQYRQTTLQLIPLIGCDRMALMRAAQIPNNDTATSQHWQMKHADLLQKCCWYLTVHDLCWQGVKDGRYMWTLGNVRHSKLSGVIYHISISRQLSHSGNDSVCLHLSLVISLSLTHTTYFLFSSQSLSVFPNL